MPIASVHRRSATRFAATLAALTLLAGCASGGSNAVGRPAASAAPLDTLLAVNGTRLFVHAEGAGDPVVVIHGGPLLDHGYLVEPLRPLAAEHRLVFYDQRLSGRSDGAVDGASVTLDAFVEDVDGVRRALGLERVHLLGHSWGGLLAMKYALAHPDRVRSLVLVSPLPPSTELWGREQAAFAASLEPADTAGMGELRASEAFGRREPQAVERMLRLSLRGQMHDPALAEGLRFHVGDDYDARSRQFARLGPELASYDLLDGLTTLDVPTLLVYGEDEEGRGIGGAALAGALPDVRVRSIADAGHFAFIERPAAFRELLARFLAERSGPRATAERPHPPPARRPSRARLPPSGS